MLARLSVPCSPIAVVMTTAEAEKEKQLFKMSQGLCYVISGPAL